MNIDAAQIALMSGKGWRKSLEPIKCSPHCRGNRWEAYRHEEAKEIRQRVLQVQGFFSPGAPGRCRIQNHIGRLWVKWFLLRCTGSNLKKTEDQAWGFQHLDLLWDIGPDLYYFLLGDDGLP